MDFAYQPAGFIVDPGATVVFVNRGQAAHTITARDVAVPRTVVATRAAMERLEAALGA